jgi:hypothetical protein
MAVGFRLMMCRNIWCSGRSHPARSGACNVEVSTYVRGFNVGSERYLRYLGRYGDNGKTP